MHVKSLSLQGIRNYRRLDVELGPGLNLFYGDNAKGKTNLLEALCFLGSLRSFRGAKPAEILAWDGDAGRISGVVLGGHADGRERSSGHRLTVEITGGKRRVALDGKRPPDAASYLEVLKVSGFSPEDLFLVKEYPSHRRRFLDRSIFHLYPGYLELANMYRRALIQLNAALKAGDEKVVRAWEDVLAPVAAEVNIRRRRQVELIRGRASEVYARVLGGGELDAEYKSAVDGPGVEEVERSYRERLAAKRQDAMRRGHALAGPHMDDLLVTLSGRDVKVAASRGQSRLALLALVLADAGLYKDERGEFPVLLLDDVASELDEKRRAALVEYVGTMGQAVLTATGREVMSGRQGLVFSVDGGGVSRD